MLHQKKLKEHLRPSNSDLLKEFVNSKVTDSVHFNIPLTNYLLICKYLSSLDVTKATGLNSIESKLLKIAPNILT